VGQAVQTGKVALNAFDFEAPTKTLKSATPAGWDYANGTYEVYDYPGNYTESGDGDHYSRVFMEELAAQQERVSGSGNVGGLAAGSLITLQRHPLSEQNREYLVLSTDYRLESDTYESTSGGDAGLDVEVSFVAQDAKRPYRSERLTPKPMVRGPQTAIVVGKSGEEIWTDKYGRIKVQFHWDRYSESDEKSSCWIRVAHPWAGKTWGAVAVPRIGQEVVVSFLEGDPDRPLVVGSVYNGDQMPPYTLPDNKTQSGVKSRSTKGAGTANFNELRFEDKKGGEDVYFHAEKDFHRLVENDDDLKVQNKQTIEIKQDRTETITDGNETVTIKKGNRTVELSTGNDSLTVKQGNRTVKINMGKSETEAMQSIELKVGQSSVKLDQKGVTINGMMVNIEGQTLVGVKGLKTDVNGDAMLTLKGGITMIN
jgi:type VI secretion system secreted protein VgrG